MRLLDLYCGAGGAAVGYHRAGYEVVGVDIEPQPRYPFPFIQADALTFLRELFHDGLVALMQYDLIHASPPCQAYSVATTARRRAGVDYADLVGPTRELLDATGLPWVIENVPGAPMRPDFKLCGCMFGLPHLKRERWFETSWRGFDLRAPCVHVQPSLSVTGHGVGAGNGQRDRLAAVLGRLPNLTDAKRAMGIEWMSRDELSQAIPPAYTEYIARQVPRRSHEPPRNSGEGTAVKGPMPLGENLRGDSSGPG